MKPLFDICLDVAGRAAKTARRATKELAATGRRLKNDIRDDVAAFRARDPAAKSDAEILLLYSGLHARLAHRLSHALHQRGHTFTARAISQGTKFFTGIEIHPAATVGRGLVIDHGAGVVIGETAQIGDNCTIYQGVTLGGTGKDVGKRHPTLGNNVMVGAGAKILGPLTIGDNAKIAAGAVVLEDIPADSTAVGIPAHVVRVRGKRIANDLDQIHIPDPVEDEVKTLGKRIDALQQELDALKTAKKPARGATAKPENKPKDE